jgi:hypothetical protein
LEEDVLVREKSMPGFKPSKNRVDFLLAANTAGKFMMKPVLSYDSLKNYTRSAKPACQHIYLQHDLLKIFNLLLKTTAQKKIPFTVLLSLHLDTHKLMEMGDETNVSMPAITMSFLQPMDQEVISIFTSHYLRNIFCKAIAAIDSDFSGESGQSKLKTFWERSTILGPIVMFA